MTPEAAKAIFLRLWASKGERIRLRRDDYDGTSQSCVVRAVVMGYKPDEIASGIDAGDRKIMVYADDLSAEYGRVSNGDIAIIRPDTTEERTLNVNDPDTSTHRLGGVLVAVSFRAGGAA